MNILITKPRAHRNEWVKRNPQAMIENGGILSHEDLERWACDKCMAQLDPDKPIPVIGGPEGMSLCPACAAPFGWDFTDCTCPGCNN